MSRREATHNANEYMRRKYGDACAHLMDDSQLKKYETGKVRNPHPVRREAFRVIFGVTRDEELGFPPRRDAKPTSTSVPGVLAAPGTVSRPDSPLAPVSDGMPSMLPVADDHFQGLVTSAAREAALFASGTEARTVSAALLELYRSELAGLCVEFVHRPVTELFPRLVDLWRRVSSHLQAGVRLRQGRDLHLLAGMTSVVLAHGCHVLGKPREGMVHVKTAQLSAEEAGHTELMAWALGTEALLTESTSGPQEALKTLENAAGVLARSRRPGTAAVRLACYEARFCAQAQLGDRVLEAINSSERALELARCGAASDLDEAGGILTFGTPKRDFFCAGPYLDLGQPALAERHALAAIEGYDTGPVREYSYGDVALAQVTVAQARLDAGHLDGVLPALTPVFELPAPLRIRPLGAPLTRLATALAQASFRCSPRAREIRAGIDEFRALPSGIMNG